MGWKEIQKMNVLWPFARPDIAQRAINQIDIVLLRDGTAALGPGAVADDTCVDLYHTSNTV